MHINLTQLTKDRSVEIQIQHQDQEIKNYIKEIQRITNRLSDYQIRIQQERTKKKLFDQLLQQHSSRQTNQNNILQHQQHISNTSLEHIPSISSSFIAEQFENVQAYMSNYFSNNDQNIHKKDNYNQTKLQFPPYSHHHQRFDKQEGNISKQLKQTYKLSKTLLYSSKHEQTQRTNHKLTRYLEKSIYGWKRPKIFSNTKVQKKIIEPHNIWKQKQIIRQTLIKEKQLEDRKQKFLQPYEIMHNSIKSKYSQFLLIASTNPISLKTIQNKGNNSGLPITAQKAASLLQQPFQNYILDVKDRRHGDCIGFYSSLTQGYKKLLNKTSRQQNKCKELLSVIKNIQYQQKITKYKQYA